MVKPVRTATTKGNNRAAEAKALLKVSDKASAEYQKLKNKRGWSNANKADEMASKSTKAFQKAADKAIQTRNIKKSVKKK